MENNMFKIDWPLQNPVTTRRGHGNNFVKYSYIHFEGDGINHKTFTKKSLHTPRNFFSISTAL